MTDPADTNSVEELFGEAIDLPPARRQAHVEAARVADAVRREVLSLLAAHEQARSVPERIDPVRVATMVGEDSAVPAATGRRIGPYRIVRGLGRGGMGVVYLAERADGAYEQRVALKVVKHGLDSEAVLARFRRERQILARLEHRSIARLLDGGMFEDGRPYFAMEYVEGEPITDYCDRRRLTTTQRLSLFRRVCEAVHYAHGNRIVHRDLKPSNILVTEDGDLKLLDFGIAKLLGKGEGAEATELTRLGLRAMTPEYAAPEQVRGEPVTTASDVYSLGVVLYELLVGRRPQGDEGARRRGAAAPLPLPTRPSAVLRTPARGPARDAGEPYEPDVAARARGTRAERLSRRLRGDLDTIVLQALREEPEQRYGSAEGLAADIRRHLDGHPVSARPASVGYRASRFLRRHRVGVAAALLVVLALLLGYFLGRPQPELVDEPFLASVVVLPFRSGSENPDDAYLAYGVSDALIGELARIPELRVIAYDSAARASAGEASPRQTARDLGVEHLLTGTTASHAGRLDVNARLVAAESGEILWAERFSVPIGEALRLQERIAGGVALGVLRRFEPAGTPSRAPKDPLALTRYLEARHAWSQRERVATERSVALFRQAIDLDPTFAEAWAGLADAYTILGAYGWMPMEASHPMARAAAMEALAIDSASAEAHASLAQVLTDYYWEWTKALDHFERAVQSRPGYATAHQWYAEALANAGRFDEALVQARLAWRLDPLSPPVDLTVGETLYKARRHREAIDHLEGTVSRHPDYGIAELVLALAEIQAGRAEAGVARLEGARRRWPDLLEIASLLGFAYGVAGQPERARAILDELSDLRVSVHVPPILFAYPYVGLGDREAALDRLEEALNARDWQLKLLAIDPVLDPLRGEPRFAELLTRAGLPRSP